MGFFSFLKKSPSGGKVFVLGLDGVPFTFLEKHFARGDLPNLGALAAGAGMHRMTSVHPTVSSVAWSSFMTGKNPGRHGIYGFVDRKPESYDVFVPTSRNMNSPTLWEVLSRAGKRVVSINVPVTYPPRPVNGVIVSGFLCSSIDRVAYPPEVSRFLKGMGYRIDAEAKLGRTDKAAFLEDLKITLSKRFEAAFALMDRDWDFFQLHVMETDRINHFLWEDYERGDTPYSEAFIDFYRQIDASVGTLLTKLPSDAELIVLSDHGFCLLKKEVYLNRFLVERNWLEFETKAPRSLGEISAEARAYSLIPGRIFMHLKGREPKGQIHGREEYRSLREGLAADLLSLKDLKTGEQVIAEVKMGEDANSNPAWGDFPIYPSSQAPAPCDLLAVPRDGYDLKGNIDSPTVFGRTELAGMHTYDDAFLIVKGRKVRSAAPNIKDLFPTILDIMGVASEESLDGTTLL